MGDYSRALIQGGLIKLSETWHIKIHFQFSFIIIIVVIIVIIIIFIKMFKEGSPSAEAGFQGALHPNTKYNDKTYYLLQFLFRKEKKKLNYEFLLKINTEYTY